MSELKDTDKHWTETLKDCYEAGYSDVEVCKELKITTQRFEQMMKENVQFRKLVEYGRTLSQAWWTEKCRTALYNKSFNSAMWAMVMKNRFGWSDKNPQEMSNVPDNQRSVEELRDEMRKLLPKVLKQFSPELTDASLVDKTSNG